MTSQTLYDILGVLEDVSPEDIKAAFRRKIQYLHPDRGGSSEAAAQVNAAYDVLSNPKQRAEYDASRRRGVAGCPICGESVDSEVDLVGHLVRHRAEIEAAQAILKRDGERQMSDPLEEVAAGGDDREPPSQVEDPARGSVPNNDSSGSRRPTWLLLAAAIAAIAVVSVVTNARNQLPSEEVLSSSQPAPWASTATETSAAPSGSLPTATNRSSTTVGPFESRAAKTWSLAQSRSPGDEEGYVEEPWSQSSEPWNQYFANENMFTIDGVPGFQKIFDGCIDDLCDYWLLGLGLGKQQAWLVMEYGLTTQVLRFTLLADESVALCWSSAEEGAPVVVAAAVGAATDRVMGVRRAWVLPGWFGDGLWRGIDAAAVDPADVVPLPLGGGGFPEC